MRDPLELLAVVVKVADIALTADTRHHVPELTLRALREDVREELSRIRETPVLDEKADMLLSCLLYAVLCNADRNDVVADEWRWLARAVLPFVRTQLVMAQAKPEPERIR